MRRGTPWIFGFGAVFWWVGYLMHNESVFRLIAALLCTLAWFVSMLAVPREERDHDPR